MITKKIHHSQTVFSPFGDYADGKYGELIIQAELNNELIGAILQMGPGLEVISPQEVRCRFKQTIKEMVYLYEDTD